jgi:ATP-dependent DNA helicase RecQ
MLWTDKAKKILLKYWKFDTLKEKQITVINEILAGNDVVGLLPTGYGKSLCYLLPALITKKTIFIVSPLISLMDDQKEKLLNMGIKVSALHCNNNNRDNEIKEILEGKIRIVYMSPEYIIDGHGLDLAKKLIDLKLLGYLAVDESHCVSSWGHDFRPNYLKLQEFRNLFPSIPIMAVTATAKDKVIKEIIRFLQLRRPQIVRANFDRPNLFIDCKPVPKILSTKKKGKSNEKREEYYIIICEYINKYPEDRIIVYVNSRDKTETVSNELNKYYNKNISNYYHAGLSKNTREEVQNNFNNNICKVIVSTIAFGMGIDQIVRCVLVFGCPQSIEEYWQQIGRGGRDGLPCETVLYYDACASYIVKLMNSKITEQSLKDAKDDNLRKVKEYYDTKKCRRQYILDYLGLAKSYFAYNGFTCSKCDNCTKHKLTDITPYIFDHYINQKPLNKKIEKYVIDFKLKHILNDWKSYVEFNKFTLTNLPKNMHIELRIDNNELNEYDILYDRFDEILNK